jgi:imidazolonepropionase-like amidohydrolase
MSIRWKVSSLLVLVLSLCGPPAAAQDFAVRNVRVFDGEQVVQSATVIVRGGLIDRVGASDTVPPGVPVIDGAGKTLLPGLIESHGHTGAGGFGLEQMLALGVTSVLDMFTETSWMAERQAEQRAGAADGRADLFSAGTSVTAPRGHGTQFGREIPTIDDAADADAFVAARLAEGSDHIKLVYEPCPGCRSIDSTTMHAVIAATRSRGRLAVAHSHLQDHARVAVAAGIHGLVHLFSDRLAEPELLEQMAARNVFVVTTLSVSAAISGHGGADAVATHPEIAPYLEPSEVRRLSMVNPNPHPWFDWEATKASLRLLRDRGIPVLAGSDPPNPGAWHGAGVHRELELLVEAGLTPLEALTAATGTPARMFRLEDRGRIAPGLRADLLLVDGDPTVDIAATRNIVAVWKRGVRFDRQAFREALAARVAAETPAAGLISGFDGDGIDATFGLGWEAESDARFGGDSHVTMTRVSGGALESPGSLRIEGELASGPNARAGVTFWFGRERGRGVDLSALTGVSFWSRGDGRPHTLHIYAEGSGAGAGSVSFVAGPEWREHHFDLSEFGDIDRGNVIFIRFAAQEPGAFSFQIDEVRPAVTPLSLRSTSWSCPAGVRIAAHTRTVASSRLTST